MDSRIAFLLLVTLAVCLSDCYKSNQAIYENKETEIACACGRIYRPLCGSDGKTYANQCEFECQEKKLRIMNGEILYIVKDEPCKGFDADYY